MNYMSCRVRLKGQLIRSRLNIAEGSTGQSNLEFKKFLGYALRSAIEVVGCIHLAKKRNLIDEKTFDLFYDKLTESY